MNGAGVHTPGVQGKDTVVIVLTITGNIANSQDVCFLRKQRGPMTGLLSTS